MAFDEEFHLGVIRLYSHHPNPFWSGIPVGGDAFGAVARDPSYLYHYLMSFPYKVLDSLVHSFYSQILILRAINIALLASSLFIFRKLLLKTKASGAVVHLSLLIFVLIPIVPMLGAQINYDNLMIPLTAFALLLTLSVTKNSTKKTLDVKSLLLLVFICLTTSLVKYAFLPIFVVIVAFLAVSLWRRYGLKKLWPALKSGVSGSSRLTLVGLVLICVLAGGLFIERYGVNLLRYHKPVVDCAEVLDYQHCQYYGPWIRDYNFKINKTASDSSPLAFSQHWFYGMWFRSVFAVDGPGTLHQTRGPLLIPGIAVIVFAVGGLLAFALTAKRLWRRYDSGVLWLFSVSSVVYSFVLWLEDYKMYLETGQPVAINGRYLLPILPLLILMSALAVKELTDGRKRLQIAMASVVILAMIWGGGVLTYVLRSNDAWYWPNNPVSRVNYDVRSVIGPITPGYHRPTDFLH